MNQKKTKKKPQLSFREAVSQTPEVENCHQNGLRALGKYSAKIELVNQAKCGGSLDIDSCVSILYPNDNRWDYAFDYDGKTYFVEVHTANTKEVSTMLNKLRWLKDWLHAKAPELKKLQADSPYFWIQSGNFDIPKTSKWYRQISAAGIIPRPKLSLP